MDNSNLRIGYVPEHFSTPLHFAKQYYGLNAQLIPFPSGTGHMITAIRAGEIDIGIGLTEAWVAGLGKEDSPGDAGYRIVGTYVETPLCWAISTGSQRPEISSTETLKGRKIGISRPGSGSQVMGYVLADQQGWLQPQSPQTQPPFSGFIPLQNFENLRRAVNDGTADFFMWEHFTSKKYYDNGEIRRVGEIYTPWSSWKIVASTALVKDHQDVLKDVFAKLDKGVDFFERHHDEVVKYVSTNLDYSAEDAAEWLRTVRFSARTEGVDVEVVIKCIDILKKAGVLKDGEDRKTEWMAKEMLFNGLAAQHPLNE
ncbi:periplasmic binding protein-like II [Poronia punctata]|nr:periplasmic binding protein-like II [Poronia punctata]